MHRLTLKKILEHSEPLDYRMRNRFTHSTEGGRPVAPDGQGRVFRPQRGLNPPKTPKPKPDRKNPHFPNSGRLFWFLFWFYGDFTHVPDDVTKPDEKRESLQSL